MDQRTQKRRREKALRAAHNRPIWHVVEQINPVMRIGAFTVGLSEKAALGRSYRYRVAPCVSGQSQNPQRASFSLKERISWGCHPPLAKARWMLMQIYALKRHGQNCFGHIADHERTQASSHCPTVGATTDPRYGCAVNTKESASRLIRFTPSKVPCGVALTGGDTMPERIDA